MSGSGDAIRKPPVELLPDLAYPPEYIRQGHPGFLLPFAALTPILHGQPLEQMVDGQLPPGMVLPIEGMEIPFGGWDTVRAAAGVTQDGTLVTGISFFKPGLLGEHTRLQAIDSDGATTDVMRNCSSISRDGGMLLSERELTEVLRLVDTKAMRDISRVALTGATVMPPDLPEVEALADGLRWYDGVLEVAYKIVKQEGANRYFSQIVSYRGILVGVIRGFTGVTHMPGEPKS